jgi:predicted nucleotidyltransferase
MGERPLDPYLDDVVSELREHLGEGLVGVYLHGSLAMGAFDPGRSDVDVLAVCAEPLPRSQRLALGHALDAIPRPPSGGDLEFSLVTAASVRTPSDAPRFEVHVSTHDRPAVIDGGDRPGDQDMVVHFAVTRARGRSLVGPAPEDLFPEPERALLIRAFLSDMRWGREEGAAAWEGHPMPELASMAYRVLNAARSWRFLETGELGSKVEGAEWVRARGAGIEDVALLDAALAFQRGDEVDPPSDAAVEAFVGRVEAMLQNAS